MIIVIIVLLTLLLHLYYYSLEIAHGVYLNTTTCSTKYFLFFLLNITVEKNFGYVYVHFKQNPIDPKKRSFYRYFCKKR